MYVMLMMMLMMLMMLMMFSLNTPAYSTGPYGTLLGAMYKSGKGSDRTVVVGVIIVSAVPRFPSFIYETEVPR